MGEREWRRQNLEWERKRREADTDADKSHRRVVDERRDRMVLRQQQREKDYKQKKQNDTDNKNSQDLTRAVKVINNVQCFHFNSISRNITIALEKERYVKFFQDVKLLLYLNASMSAIKIILVILDTVHNLRLAK
jgi:hypothetical protein